MNCNPGDTAAIVYCPRGAEHLRGRIVRLTNRAPDSPAIPWRPEIDARVCWYYEGERLVLRSGKAVEYLNDCCLRPIRDPGDDAQDEMLRPLPKAEPAPARQEVPA